MTKESDFIAKVTPGALATERDQKVPAAVTIAQAILESGWGTSDLATKANALFGIKANDQWSGGTYTKDTQEWDGSKYITVRAPFRAYGSWAESISDHADYLATRRVSTTGPLRYAEAFKTTDPDEFARRIHKAGYATSPTYADSLIRLMDQYGLRDIKPAPAQDTDLARKVDDLTTRLDATQQRFDALVLALKASNRQLADALVADAKWTP